MKLRSIAGLTAARYREIQALSVELHTLAEYIDERLQAAVANERNIDQDERKDP